MSKKKRVLLICPKWAKGGLSSILFFQWPSYGLLQLASLTPNDWEVKIVNERDQIINFNEETDLIGITSTTSSALRAYEIADTFRRQGKKVILGGVHVSALPEEASRHADSVVCGEADLVWEQILRDFESGKLKERYICEAPQNLDLSFRRIQRTYSIPHILFKYLPYKFGYFQFYRGCPHNCKFCNVAKFNGRKLRCKSVSFFLAEVERELANGMTHIVFVDDNIMTNPVRSRELFSQLRHLNVKWMSQTDIRIADPETLSLAKESGLAAVFLGLESIDSTTLKDSVSTTKGEWRKNYESAIKRLKDARVIVEGAFVFGFDGEAERNVTRTVEWALDNKLDLAQFAILTPFPGTDLFSELESRLATRDWSLYNLLYSVFKGTWDNRVLESLTRQAYKEFYTSDSIRRRLNRKVPLLHYIYALLSNLEFRRLAYC